MAFAHRRKFRDDEVTDLIDLTLEQVKKRSHELNNHMQRTVRKLERITTPAPSQPMPEVKSNA